MNQTKQVFEEENVIAPNFVLKDKAYVQLVLKSRTANRWDLSDKALYRTERSVETESKVRDQRYHQRPWPRLAWAAARAQPAISLLTIPAQIWSNYDAATTAQWRVQFAEGRRSIPGAGLHLMSDGFVRMLLPRHLWCNYNSHIYHLMFSYWQVEKFSFHSSSILKISITSQHVLQF